MGADEKRALTVGALRKALEGVPNDYLVEDELEMQYIEYAEIDHEAKLLRMSY